MTSTFRISVSSKVLEWAIQNGEMNHEVAFSRFPKLSEWISGKVKPTFNQLKKFSYDAHVPFDYLLNKDIPQENYPFIKYRTINNKEEDHPSRKLIDTINYMELRQGWMQDYLEKEDSGYSFNYHNYIKLAGNEEISANKISKLIEIDRFRTVDRQDNAFFNSLKDRISELGIMVMQNGIVGNNTHRELDLNEFRAFAINDDIAPLIFINAADSKKAKVFSLIHELIHILINDSEILNATIDQSDKIKKERWINKVTASILMPKTEIISSFDKIHDFNKLSNFFHASTAALSIRLKTLGLITNSEVQKIINNSKPVKNNNKSSGNYYNNVASRVDPRFVAAVYTSETSNRISLEEASDAIGVSVKTYPQVVSKVLGLD